LSGSGADFSNRFGPDTIVHKNFVQTFAKTKIFGLKITVNLIHKIKVNKHLFFSIHKIFQHKKDQNMYILEASDPDLDPKKGLDPTGSGSATLHFGAPNWDLECPLSLGKKRTPKLADQSLIEQSQSTGLIPMNKKIPF
jgi:hypothetical protein